MKINILLLLYVLCGTATFGQPILTAASTNPTIGDVFYEYRCDTALLTVGTAGAGVTWNYSGVAITSIDTTFVTSCAATPHCDSAPAGSIAERYTYNYKYTYLNPTSTDLNIVGIYHTVAIGGPGNMYNNFSADPWTQLKYPLTFGDSYLDASIDTILGNNQVSYAWDTVRADGYGTLVLPSGTYTNVLRVKHSMYTEVTFFTSTTHAYQKNSMYEWFAPGFHHPLLHIVTYNDLATGAELYLAEPKFSASIPLGVAGGQTKGNVGLQIYPNPASDAINISSEKEISGVSVADIMGHNLLVANYLPRQKEVKLPIDNIPNGLYFLQIQSADGIVVRKMQVAR